MEGLTFSRVNMCQLKIQILNIMTKLAKVPSKHTHEAVTINFNWRP